MQHSSSVDSAAPGDAGGLSRLSASHEIDPYSVAPPPEATWAILGSKATERIFPFDDETIDVHVDNDAVNKFRRLLLEHPDPGEETKLVDPITHRAYDVPLQVMERRAREALDSMAWKQSLFLSLVDHIDAHDAQFVPEQSAAGEVAHAARQKLLALDRPEMVRRAIKTFGEIQAAKQLAEDFETSYEAMRLIRISRLQEAIKLTENQPISEWTSKDALVGAINEEIREMELGVRPSDWYRVQHLFAEESGLLLFSPHQIDIAGMHVGEDMWHNGPIKGTVDEIVSMLSVYVDGAAALKRRLDDWESG